MPFVILIYNVVGAANPGCRRRSIGFVYDYHPHLMVVTKTRVSRAHAKDTMKHFGYCHAQALDPIGYLGGEWLLWNCNNADVDLAMKKLSMLELVVYHPCNYGSRPSTSVPVGVYEGMFVLVVCVSSWLVCLCFETLESVLDTIQNPWINPSMNKPRIPPSLAWNNLVAVEKNLKLSRNLNRLVPPESFFVVGSLYKGRMIEELVENELKDAKACAIREA
ncbi:hypothetical protein CCACVL1_16057 [Corchorus capsularis]|uniref:Uncharacterized protein n=1 Tax=Corchorus capsularis TaxID=210143 RepID=A0A1R3HZM3_COCAP|nr:hypothetical protein CCACVL1_16057 [Corchorus capsularis]